MKKYLSMGAFALALAGMPPPQADAGVKMHLGFGIDFSICCDDAHPWRCGPGRCGHRRSGTIAAFPAFEHPHPPHHPPFPPPPGPGGPGRKEGGPKGEEAALQWGYPSLNYSYYHPVSYYPTQNQPTYNPADYYSPPQYYYPQNYSSPGYYQAPGITFDR